MKLIELNWIIGAIFASSKGYIIRIVKSISMSVKPHIGPLTAVCFVLRWCWCSKHVALFTTIIRARVTDNNQLHLHVQFYSMRSRNILLIILSLVSIQLMCRQLSAVKGSNVSLSGGAGYRFQVRWVSNCGMHNIHVRHPPHQNFELLVQAPGSL